MPSPLTLALELRAQGVAPIPIICGTKPAAIRWRSFQNTAPTPAQVRDWFDRDDLTVGVVCGEPSDNLLVLDADTEHASDDWFDRLHDPATWIVKTSRGFSFLPQDSNTSQVVALR